jgi:hypothetical protein
MKNWLITYSVFHQDTGKWGKKQIIEVAGYTQEDANHNFMDELFVPVTIISTEEITE